MTKMVYSFVPALLLGFACTSGFMLAQSAPATRTVTVRVVDDISHQPLVNAEVIDLATGRGGFTSERGEASIASGAGASLQLRVREIGFRFAERNVQLSSAAASPTDTIVVMLHPVSYKLPTLTTVAANACGAVSDTAVGDMSAEVLAQLRLGAERYEAFRRAYPFRVFVERRTTQRDTLGAMQSDPLQTASDESERWGNPYVPEHVFRQDRQGDFSVPILFVSALAAPEFWTHHCFVARGVVTLDSERVVRLDFTPTKATKAPDWEGSAYVDSATSMLRRVDFDLTHFRKRDGLKGLVGYTTFQSPTANIAMPSATVALWWFDQPLEHGNLRPADGFQSVVVRRVVYRDSIPPNPTNP